MLKTFEILIVFWVVFAVCGCRGPEVDPESSHARQSDEMEGFGMWFATQEPPDTDPRLFAQLQISSGNGERCVTFSPDLAVLFHQLAVSPGYSSIVSREIVDGTWTPAHQASFSGLEGCRDAGPAFADDGTTLVFYSDRPTGLESIEPGDFNFWSVTRTLEGWTSPIVLGPGINSNADDEDISFTDGGVAYFSSNRHGNYDIYRIRWNQNGAGKPDRLGPMVNSPFFEGHPCVAPDESFLLFSSGGRPDEVGNADLYISFRDSSDTWSPAQIFDGRINTTSHEAAPTLSPDGKYLFFLSQREKNSDIYWVDISIIEDFRPISHRVK